MTYIIGKDKYRQPVFLVRIRLVRPKESTDERVRQFAFYRFEQAVKEMGEDADKYEAVVDFKDAGLSNFDFGMIRKMIPIALVPYPAHTRYRAATRSGYTRSAW